MLSPTQEWYDTDRTKEGLNAAGPPSRKSSVTISDIVERAEAGKLQDQMIQALQSKLQEVNTSNRELTENNEFKEMQLLESNASCDRARFKSRNTLNAYRNPIHLFTGLNCFKLSQELQCFKRKKSLGRNARQSSIS